MQTVFDFSPGAPLSRLAQLLGGAAPTLMNLRAAMSRQLRECQPDASAAAIEAQAEDHARAFLDDPALIAALRAAAPAAIQGA